MEAWSGALVRQYHQRYFTGVKDLTIFSWACGVAAWLRGCVAAWLAGWLAAWLPIPGMGCET